MELSEDERKEIYNRVRAEEPQFDVQDEEDVANSVEFDEKILDVTLPLDSDEKENAETDAMEDISCLFWVVYPYCFHNSRCQLPV